MLYAWAMVAVAWAQDDDDEGNFGKAPRMSDDADIEGLDEYSPINISFGDIIRVAFILLVAYLLSKVWKGCSYIFLVVIVVIYLLDRYLYI